MKRFLSHTFTKSLKTLVFAAAVGVSAVAVAQEAPALDPVDFQQIDEQASLDAVAPLAIQVLAQSRGLDAAVLTVEHSTIARYPLSGVTAFAFKALNQTDGSTHSIIVDESGLELSSEELLAGEEEAYAATFGKMHPDLAGLMPLVGAGETVPVMIWLNEDTNLPAVQRPAPGQERGFDLEALAAESDAARREAIAATVAPLSEFLATLGFEVAHNEIAPIIYAHLDAKTIEEIQSLPEVHRVYLDQQNEPTLNVARVVVRANTVNSRGFSGTGIKVAEIEVGGRINTSNPYLAGVVQDNTDSCLHAHATAVAGMIRSTHATHKGIAPAVSLRVGGSCGGWSSELQGRTNAAKDWGARVFNNSWGSTSGSRVPDGNARFFDTFVLTQWRTVVFAAGNRGGAGCSQGTDGVVTNPAIAYNVIAVGNHDDKGTTTTTGDTMNACSSWLDPISGHSDREKPEISAPGTNISSTTNASPWVANTGSGTSYAAPMVSGGAALLIQRNSSLSVWPEAVKAILMATALQNVEGAARLSERDGAGGINLDRADDVARGVNGNWSARSYDCSAAADTDVMNMALVAGKRTRVVIVWDTDPAYGSYESQPSADLDLKIIAPNGTTVTGSYSFDNTYEIVDFTPTVSGTYRIRVNKYRCNLSPRYLGYAWYRMP